MRDRKNAFKILGQMSKVCRLKEPKSGRKIILSSLVNSHSKLTDPVYEFSYESLSCEFFQNRKSLPFSHQSRILTFNQQSRKKIVSFSIFKRICEKHC